MEDYYTLLGLSKSASAQEIKAAYRKKALEWHPDRNKDPKAADQFKKINEAYEVLSNSEKKQTYDQYGHDAFKQSGRGNASQNSRQGPFNYSYSSSSNQNPFEGFGGSDPFDIFEQFFGFQNPNARRRARPAYQISITFNEAVHGTEKDVRMDGEQKKIKIPAGIDNGMRIRFSDFDLIVAVAADKRFRREGQDIYLEVSLSFTQAILGGTLNVPTLDGEVKIKIKQGTQPNTMLRLQGKGIIYPNTRKYGDEYIIFKIKIPERINNTQKKLLQEFEEQN